MRQQIPLVAFLLLFCGLCGNAVIRYTPQSLSIEIEESVSYAATKIILGKNVVVKSGATLRLTADEEFEIRDNVVCEKGAKLELKHKN
jgi:acetyltransferase-like isoleucine patch superfamily enzyme